MGTGDEKRMKQFTYVITDEIGIHARPAGLLAKEAKQFQSTVMLTCKGRAPPQPSLWLSWEWALSMVIRSRFRLRDRMRDCL